MANMTATWAFAALTTVSLVSLGATADEPVAPPPLGVLPPPPPTSATPPPPLRATPPPATAPVAAPSAPAESAAHPPHLAYHPLPPRQVSAECLDECKEDGTCTYDGDDCVAHADWECRGSELCREHGRCTARDDECVATAATDCLISNECEDEGDCFIDLEKQRCESRRTSPGMMAGGIVLMGLGGGSFAVGLATSALSFGKTETASTVAMIGGIAVAMGAGLPLTLVGNRKVRPEDEPSGAPTVRLGLGAADVTWTF